MRRLLTAILLLGALSPAAGCDWRGYEHERAVAARSEQVSVQAAQAQVDDFDLRCRRDAAACWDELVKAARTSAIGPAPGATGVTEVCCLQPRTDVSADVSFPSGFTLGVDGGTVTVGISNAGGQALHAPTTTMRGLPATQTTFAGDRTTWRWIEGGHACIAIARGVGADAARRALEALVLHQP